MDRAELEALDRDRLIERAEALHVPRARILTRPELIDEILLARAREDQNPALFLARGFFGRARDLVARVVERGLHLPDAADRIRAAELPVPGSVPPGAPVPTVTLAEMYAAQGHLARARATLEDVLRNEPDHTAARELLARYSGGTPVEEGGASAAAAEGEAGEGKGTPSIIFVGPGAVEAEGTAASSGVAARPTLRSAALASTAEEPSFAEDACVAVPVDASTLFVLWQLSGRSHRYWLARAPQGRPALRLLVIQPTWDGPQRSHRDLGAAFPEGELLLRGLPRGAVLRVALGWLAAGELHAFAQSPALELPASPTWPLSPTALLRTGSGQPVATHDRDAPLIARAVARAAAQVE